MKRAHETPRHFLAASLVERSPYGAGVGHERAIETKFKHCSKEPPTRSSSIGRYVIRTMDTTLRWGYASYRSYG